MEEPRRAKWRSLFRSCVPSAHAPLTDDDGWSLDFERKDSFFQEAENTEKAQPTAPVEDCTTASSTRDDDSSFYSTHEYEFEFGEHDEEEEHTGGDEYEIEFAPEEARTGGDEYEIEFVREEHTGGDGYEIEFEEEEEEEEHIENDENSFHSATESKSCDDDDDEEEEEEKIEDEDESDLEDPVSTGRYSLEPSEPDEKESNVENYRFLFRKYWKQQQGTRHLDVDIPHQICIPMLKTKTNERHLFQPRERPENEVIGIGGQRVDNEAQQGLKTDHNDEKLNAGPQARRSIFTKQCYVPEPEPKPEQVSDGGSNKNQSNTTGAIVEQLSAPLAKPKGSTSSLRPCRYSGDLRRSFPEVSNVKRSVSFNEQTQVTVYEKPVEQYDNKGWHNLFA